MADTVETAIYKMSSDSSQYVTAMNNAATAAQKAVDATEGVTVATEKVDRATRLSTTGLERMLGRLDPRIKAEQQLSRALDQVQRYEEEGIGTSAQRLRAMDLVVQRYHDQISAIDKSRGSTEKATAAVGLAQHELINLGRQVQDVGVSLVGGQSPFMVLAQQAPQVADIFISSQASVKDFFTQVSGWAGRILTPLNLAAGGIVALGTAAAFAANSWGDSQRQIGLSLSGIGRASGVTVDDINRIGEAYSSLNGLSRSETRDFATTLAATGKIGLDMTQSLVKVGKDVARIYGVDAADAAKMLGKTFADPVRGADELNSRLGFLDRAMQQQIKNLTEQNRLYEAQQLLLKGVQSSTDRIAQSSFWTAIGNFGSNALDKFGQVASRVTGIGYDPSIAEQVQRQQQVVEQLQAQMANRPRNMGLRSGYYENLSRRYQEESAALDVLNGKLDKYNQNLEETAKRQESLRLSPLVDAALPDARSFQQIDNAVKSWQSISGDQGLMEKLGITPEEWQKGKVVLGEMRDTFRTTFQQLQDQGLLESRAIGAVSPRARAELARQQVLSQLNGAGGRGLAPDEKDAIAWQAYTNVLKQAAFAASELGRERLLQSRQSTEASMLDIELIGKTVGEQYKLRTELALRQQLEQEAARNRTAFDEAQFERLRKEIDLQAQLKQIEAERRLADDLAFDRAQLGRTDVDQQVASRLRSAGLAVDLDGPMAAAIRLNEQLSQARQLSSEFANSFVSDLRNGVPVVQALTNALGNLADKLLQMATDRAIAQLFGNLGGLFPGISTSPVAMTPVDGAVGVVGANGPFVTPTFNHSGGIVGASPPSGRYVHPAYFDRAPRFHNGGLLPGEMPIVAMAGEEVLKRSDPRHILNGGQWMMGGGGGYGAASLPPQVIINNYAASSTDVSVQQQKGPDGRDLVRIAVSEVKKDMANGGFDGVLRSRFGSTPAPVRR